MKSEDEQMVFEKSWEEFRETGLLLFTNSILHIFGWAIVVELDDETNEVLRCYPARVKFRGFSEKSVDNAHKKLAKYMVENSEELLKETLE